MTCRKISGAPVSAYVIFAVDQVTISGDFRSWSATPKTEDCFCPICGSQVFARYSDTEIEIRLGAFDEPNLFTPTYELWAKRREHWLCTPDLESFSENRDPSAVNSSYFGCMRRAPSRRMASPLSMSFSMMLHQRRVFLRPA